MVVKSARRLGEYDGQSTMIFFTFHQVDFDGDITSRRCLLIGNRRSWIDATRGTTGSSQISQANRERINEQQIAVDIIWRVNSFARKL